MEEGLEGGRQRAGWGEDGVGGIGGWSFMTVKAGGRPGGGAGQKLGFGRVGNVGGLIGERDGLSQRGELDVNKQTKI